MTKNKKQSKTVVIALIVLLALMSIVLISSFASRNEPKPNNKVEQTPPDDNFVVENPVESGVQLSMRKIDKKLFAQEGIDAQAESAYELTATVLPADATNKEVDWSIAFVNASSAWATGKTVTTFATLTPTADGALTAQLVCKQAFGEQIKVTVTSRDNTSAKAEATLDYYKRVTAVSGTLDNYFMQVNYGGAVNQTVQLKPYAFYDYDEYDAPFASEGTTYEVWNGIFALTDGADQKPHFTYGVGTIQETYNYAVYVGATSSARNFELNLDADEGDDYNVAASSILGHCFSVSNTKNPNSAKLIELKNAIQSKNGVMYLTIVATGAQSGTVFTKTITLTINASSFYTSVNSVSLNHANIKF